MRVCACANHIEPCIKSSSPRSNATSTLFSAPTGPSVGRLVSFNTHLHFHLISSYLISSHLDFLHTYPEPLKPSPSCSVYATHESMAETTTCMACIESAQDVCSDHAAVSYRRRSVGLLHSSMPGVAHRGGKLRVVEVPGLAGGETAVCGCLFFFFFFFFFF